ncbi:MAG: hypothetical protein JXR18_11385 [Neptuniibacter sp.]
MFNKHTTIYTENNSLNIQIVHIDFDLNKIAYYDLNQEPVKRRNNTRGNHKPSSLAARVQRKPSVMDINDFQESISNYQYKVARTEYNNGLYVPANKPHLEKIRIRDERIEAAEYNYDLIAPIVEDDEKFRDFLYRNQAQKYIEEISLESGVSRVQISRLLSQYCLRGGCKNAMYPNYRFCGSNYQPAKEINDPQAKRGRPSTRTNYRNFTAKDEELIKDHIRKLGKKKFKQYSYQAQYELFDYHKQSKAINYEEDGVTKTRRVPLPQRECISYSQYYNYVKKLERDQSFAFRSKGEKTYLREYKNRLKRARDGVYGPSFRYEIDATIEDLYLSFPYFTEERLSIGRPTTYKAVCPYSGIVAGIHVGIGGPNWKGVMQLLYNTFTDKVEFCKQFGIVIDHETWPCDVICNELTIDNGVEYPSENIVQILEELFGIDCINYTKIYYGQGKGNVEGSFEIDKKESIQFMPGYVERQPERGSAHASNSALYTYDEFMRLLIIQTLIRNNEAFNNRNHDQVMSEQGVGATALEIWNFGMRHYMNNGRGKRMPKEELMFGLLPTGKASTTEKGIKFKKLYYTCNHAAQKGWLTADKSRPVKKLDVRYFDGSTNKIWYRHEGKIYTAHLNSHSEIFENRSWFDALHRLELYELEKAQRKELERENRFDQRNITKEITDQAIERFKNSRSTQNKAPSNKISTIAYLEQIRRDHKSSSLINLLLSDNKDDRETLSGTTLQINSKKTINDKNFLSIYGGNN